MEYFTLANNKKIPVLGYGTYGINDANIIENALQCGYRLIDTAAHYYNEEMVGAAVHNSKIPREQIYITTKLWYSNMGYENTIKAFEQSLDKMNLTYIDLYLIHWPAAEPKYSNWKEINRETWEAMESIYFSGKVKAIGTCNFMKRHMEALLSTCKIRPMVNQIENHLGFYQNEVEEFCKLNNIQLMAWGPLGTGEILGNLQVRNIANKYHKTPADICLRWNYQHGFISIPKTSNERRMQENLDIFDFSIECYDMKLLDTLPFCGGQGAIVK